MLPQLLNKDYLYSLYFWMAPRWHLPSLHPAYLATDAAETKYDASELHAKEYPHPYLEYLIWHLHEPKAERKR